MKANQVRTNEFHAKDVFSRWQKLVWRARNSVTVYSPFLNETINELLESVASGVKIKIITRLDEDSLCGNGNAYQLKALLKAKCEQSASIFHLPGLHAKILLVDNEFVSIGSQNYTNRGRKNKEASFVSKSSFLNSKLLREIEEWNGCVENVSESYLEELYNNIIEDCKDFQKRKLELKKKIEEIKERHKRSELNLTTKRTATLTRYDGNNNLTCKSTEHLTNWVKKHKRAELEKGLFYPIINLDTKQMVFARVSKTVISFIEKEKACDNVLLGNKSFDVKIVFPGTNCSMSNVKMFFKSDSGKEIKLKYFFDGNNFELKSKRNSNRSAKHKIISELESRKDTLLSFFEPFHASIQEKEHIADEFAMEYKYEAGIKIFGEVEIISIKPIT